MRECCRVCWESRSEPSAKFNLGTSIPLKHHSHYFAIYLHCSDI